MTRGPRVVVEGLTVSIAGRMALAPSSGVFEAGSLTAVCGPNGAGKSTLLAVLGGALPPTGGRFRCEPSTRVAYLPQAAVADPGFPIPVLDVALLGHARPAGGNRARDAARAALQAVGLEGYDDRLLGELSAGERQRTFIARAVVEDAPLVLLDEPLAALDDTAAQKIVDLIRRWHAAGRTVVAVMHDIARVRAVFPQAVLLANRVVAWGATTDVLACTRLVEPVSAASASEAPPRAGGLRGPTAREMLP